MSFPITLPKFRCIASRPNDNCLQGKWKIDWGFRLIGKRLKVFSGTADAWGCGERVGQDPCCAALCNWLLVLHDPAVGRSRISIWLIVLHELVEVGTRIFGLVHTAREASLPLPIFMPFVYEFDYGQVGEDCASELSFNIILPSSFENELASQYITFIREHVCTFSFSLGVCWVSANDNSWGLPPAANIFKLAWYWLTGLRERKRYSSLGFRFG